MNDQLTQRQKDLAVKLGSSKNLSLPDKLQYVNFIIFIEDNHRRYDNFSIAVREGMECLMFHGPDWRATGQDNGKLDRLIGLVENLKVVAATGSDEELRDEVKKLDTSEGFVK